MSNKNSEKQPNINEMKKAIEKAGGLFYQYRPCRRDATTIYDIENIRHGVLYAQTPLNMNDPFDSMIGFSANKLYKNTLSMIINAFDLDENTKAGIQLLLEHRAFGKMGELIKCISELKRYIKNKQIKMHKTHLSFEDYVLESADVLYSKLPRSLKSIFAYPSFLFIAEAIGQINEVNITEDELVSFFKLDDTLDRLHSMIENIQSETYIPIFQRFLSKLTVSCFSASGWDNQLMWSHYANSYSGICVEYDFRKINDFVGFIYPVNYTHERPTVSLQDLGVSGIDNNGKILHCDMNVNTIFSYLLSKNKCWSYEDEWRIINIGEENTPTFINMPFIKSITLGINIDDECKRLLFDICKEKNIECYELILSKENFTLYREQIDLDKISYNMKEETEHISFLAEHISNVSTKLINECNAFTESINQTEIRRDQIKSIFSQTIDFLSDIYYINTSLNRLSNNCEGDLTIMDVQLNHIKNTNDSVHKIKMSIEEFKSFIMNISLSGKITPKESLEFINQISDINELIERVNQVSWNANLTSDCDDSSD